MSAVTKKTRKGGRDGLTTPAHREDKENALKLGKIIHSQ